jgi:hypothetical protein
MSEGDASGGPVLSWRAMPCLRQRDHDDVDNNASCIQIIAGILGGHAAAAVAKEHGFGLVGHTLAGALRAAAGGLFLQTLAATVITASGSVSEPAAVENAVVQGLTGAVAGGCGVTISPNDDDRKALCTKLQLWIECAGRHLSVA